MKPPSEPAREAAEPLVDEVEDVKGGFEDADSLVAPLLASTPLFAFGVVAFVFCANKVARFELRFGIAPKLKMDAEGATLESRIDFATPPPDLRVRRGLNVVGMTGMKLSVRAFFAACPNSIWLESLACAWPLAEAVAAAPLLLAVESGAPAARLRVPLSLYSSDIVGR